MWRLIFCLVESKISTICDCINHPEYSGLHQHELEFELYRYPLVQICNLHLLTVDL